MEAKLAIVIPAYKIDYFEQCLESIAQQTNSNFILYVGIDGSPSDFETIIEKFAGSIQVHYKRFEDNLGKIDLVAHWERCINLVKDEEWIWLFSDDDFMDANCVESFYNALNDNTGFDLFHFDILQVDQHNQLVRTGSDFPKIFKIEDFIKKRLNHNLMSLVVEYIFKRKKFDEVGGFQKFDLAWGTDDCTWIKIAFDKGICNLESAKVYWRRSERNISTIKDYEILKRKYQARIEQAVWLQNFLTNNPSGYNCESLKKDLLGWFKKFVFYEIEFMDLGDACRYSFRFVRLTGQNPLNYFRFSIRLIVLKLKHILKHYLKKWIRLK